MGWLHLRRSWDWHLGPTRGSTQIAGWFILWKIKKKTWMMNEGSTIFGQFNYVAFMQPLIRGKMMLARCFFFARNTWFNHQTWWICQETTIGYHGMSWCAWKAWVTQEAMASLPRPVGKSWFPWVGNCKNQSNQGHFSWDKSAELRSLANWLVSPCPVKSLF